MSWISRLVDRIEARVNRPADQSVLKQSPRAGSERMIESEDAQQASEAAKGVRRRRTNRTSRWLNR